MVADRVAELDEIEKSGALPLMRFTDADGEVHEFTMRQRINAYRLVFVAGGEAAQMREQIASLFQPEDVDTVIRVLASVEVFDQSMVMKLAEFVTEAYASRPTNASSDS